jgi:tetratricopeptide (TPR) repeat protein
MSTNAFLPAGGSFGAGRPAVDQQIDAVERMRIGGDYAGALKAAERLAHAHPKNARALNEKGVCLRLAMQPVKAALEFRKARKLAPDSPGILANLANCLVDLEEPENAIRAYRKALELRPDFIPVQGELGQVYHSLGQLQKAVSCYEKVIGLDSNNGNAYANLASAKGELGEFESSLEAVDRGLSILNHDPRCMVVKSIALHQLDRKEEAARLVDLEWVRSFHLENVQGFGSVASFNQALVEHVTNHPTLAFEPSKHTTKGGQQSDSLLLGEKGPVGQLEGWIRECVTTYLEALPSDPQHPYLSHRPDSFRWNVWGTVLASGGHQTQHIHPGGWVSGAYYAQLPPAMEAPNDQHVGWIQFGGAPDSWQLRRPLPLHDIEPKEGMLVLFPSYYYHRTLPFEGGTKRVSIAFDAMPE